MLLVASAPLLWCGCEGNGPTRPEVVEKEKDAQKSSREQYNVYLGNLHSHSTYSGDVTDTDDTVDALFSSAKAQGYDFYAVTDHSQYDSYNEEAWKNIKTTAEKYSDSKFVGIRGYEHSENNGPDAKGHLNVFNTDTYLNALADGVSMQYFHNWLAKTENKKAVVCMNHPSTTQYNTFYCYNNGAKSRIRLIELINGKNDHHDAFLVALEKGWKVSPVAGCDNHGLGGVKSWVPRTGILAKTLSYDSLVEAMTARRTYATFDTNLKAVYYVNNYDMGSELNPEENVLKFHIEVSDPDTGVETNKIKKIQIVGEGNKVVQEKEFDACSVSWDANVSKGHKYYYVKVYNGSRTTPVAYLAPVWIND